MIQIRKIDENEKVRIFPNPDDFGDDCFSESEDDNDVGSMLSVLAVNALIGITQVRIGNSNTVVECLSTGHIGTAGMTEFAEAGLHFLKLAKAALPEMSEKYQIFFKKYIADFEENGIVMPIEGCIMAPHHL